MLVSEGLVVPSEVAVVDSSSVVPEGAVVPSEVASVDLSPVVVVSSPEVAVVGSSSIVPGVAVLDSAAVVRVDVSPAEVTVVGSS